MQTTTTVPELTSEDWLTLKRVDANYTIIRHPSCWNTAWV